MSSTTTPSGDVDARAEGTRVLDRLEEENRRLTEVAERYRRLLEHSTVGVWEIDAEARTSFVNASMCAMLGFTEEEMLGRGLFEFMDDEARAEAERNLARRESGIREQHDFRLRRKDGSPVWTHMSTAPIFGAGERYDGALAFVTDISEARRAAEERERFNEKLVQTQKFESLGALAGGIAHEFNNLLQSILGEASLAVVEVGADGAAGAAFEAIQRSAEQAAKLTRQMLAFAGRGPSASERRELGTLVRDMEPLFRASLGRAIDLSVEVEPGLPEAEIDVAQIRQLLMNLVANSADAVRPRGGEVRVTVSYRELDASDAERLLPVGTVRPGPSLRIRVEDQGPGIAPEILPRAFEPFVTTRESGRGLGLAAVLGIARHHRGGVEVETSSSGTIVSVYLPSRPAVPSVRPEPTPEPGEHRVLVVDDEPMVQRIVQLSLERAGYGVVAAKSAEEALRLLDGSAAGAAMVLLDVSLPGMSGEEAYSEIRARTGAHVMFCSGYAASEGIRALLDAGEAVSFMQKPYRPTALVAAVDGVLRPKKG